MGFSGSSGHTHLGSPHTPPAIRQDSNLPPRYWGLNFDQYDQSARSAGSRYSHDHTNSSSPSFDQTATSPVKKTNTKKGSGRGNVVHIEDNAGDGGRRGTPNKRWPTSHSEHLLRVLVDEERKGNKADKRFKPCAINRAVEEVNAKFGESYTASHVSNHLKQWKAKWVCITEALHLSGAGWDDNRKIITVSEECHSDLKQRNPRIGAWVNVPIPFYDLLVIVCGDDHATGSSRKTVYQAFGSSSDSAVPLDDSQDPNDDVVVLENQPTTRTTQAGSSGNQSCGSGSKRTRRSGKEVEKKMKAEAAAMRDDMMKEMVTTMKHGFSVLMNKELSQAVFSISGFQKHILLAAYRWLVTNKEEGLIFSGMPEDLRVEWMENWKNNNNPGP